MKIENQNLSSSVYLNDDKSEARMHFWPSNEEGVETAQLHFKTEEEDGTHCEPTPYKITYSKSVLNTGTKINIEVAENGFIVKVGSKTSICDTEYSLKGMIDTVVNNLTEHELDYDESEHNFSNLDEAINSVIEELATS